MMKSYGLFGFLGFVSLSVVLALPARAEDAPHVFISEINWAGSAISTADEWIELVNLGPTTVDLSHYVLTKTATSGGAIEVAEGTLLEPNQTLIIANYALGDPKTSLLISPNLVTAAISLPNSSLDILLTTPAGLVIDNYTDAGTPDFGLTSPATSIERDLTTLAWRSSTQNLNLSSTLQMGTPGVVSLPIVVNGNPLPEVEPVEVAPVEPVIETPIEPIVETPPFEPEPLIEQPVLEESDTEVIPETTPEVMEDVIEVITDAPVEILPILETESVNEPVITPSTPSTSSTSSAPDEPVNTSRIQEITPGEVVINELVCDPTDSIEWVEFLNTTEFAIDLTGSTLVDAGDHVTALPNEILAAGALLVIENPNGNLNNTTETLSLFDSYGTLINTLSYGSAEIPAPQDGESLSRNLDGAWSITTATRNTNNLFPVAAVEPVTDPSSSSTSSLESETEIESSISTYETLTDEPYSPFGDSGTTPESVATTNDAGSATTEPIHRIVAIAKSVNGAEQSSASTSKKANAQVTITGIVVALPDTFGKQTMYVDGHEIYFHAADWPTLALGDVVQVTGTESDSNGVPRLKISDAEAIVVTNHAELAPMPIDGSELSTTPHGTLISVSGHVVGKDGNDLTIMTDDGTTVTALSNKKTGVSWSNMQSGTIIVIGIAKHTNAGVVIAPRSNDDVYFTSDTAVVSVETPKTKTNTTPLVGGGLLTGSIGALGTWYMRSRKGLLSWLPF